MQVLLKDIINHLESIAPLVYQENYDNSGLLVGDKEAVITAALLTLDCTEAVVDEAISKKCNLIIAHHPILFKGLKSLTGKNYVEKTIIKAIQNNIAIYAAHTNLDNVKQGVNAKIAEKLGLINLQILAPKTDLLKKLVTFVPVTHIEQVKQAIFSAGAGHIGNYDACSFTTDGVGTYRGNEDSQPFIGEKGKVSSEKEIRLEVIYSIANETKILHNLLEAHPYEEVAYDVYSIDNTHLQVGSGMVGELPEAISEQAFLELIKRTFKAGVVKHTSLLGKSIKRIALCGGSGSFLIKNAIHLKSDAYISSDIKYHEFFDAENKLILADIGHFESEQYTPEIFYEVFREKFANFATYLSEINTNPVNYF